MFKGIMVSMEVYNTLYMQANKGESMDALLRRLLGIPQRNIVSQSKTSDKRKKYPVVDMQPGDEIVVPWNRDAKGHAQIGGLNSTVSRCNRIPGRSYRSTSTAAGLHIVRLT